MKPLTYREVMDLPADHPDSIRFIKEIKDLDDCHADVGDVGSVYDDEESMEYFDHFVAGDRCEIFS